MMSRTLHLLLLVVLAGIVRAGATSGSEKNLTDGPHTCGGVDIPYPFGVANHNGDGDFLDGFKVICDAGNNPGLATTGGDGKPVGIGNISIEKAEATVWLPVVWQCYNSSGYNNGSGDYTNLEFNDQGVYRISNVKNYLFVLGCATIGFLPSDPSPIAGDSNRTSYAQLTGCVCYCNDSHSAVSGACSGVGCCHTDVPSDLLDNAVYFDDSSVHNALHTVNFSACDYAFLAEKDYYTFNTSDLKRDLSQNPWLMPVRLDWAIRDNNLTCSEATEKKGYACISSNSRCLNSTNGPGYTCSCREGYEGNPYILDGCTDINECEHPEYYPCGGVCENKQGSYECTCDTHSRSADPFKEPCRPNWTQKTKVSLGSAMGSVVAGFIVVIIVIVWLLAREKRKIREHFKKNGGPILEKLNYIRLFTQEDLKKIQKNRKFIGRGSYGKVYMGHIEDSNQTVAVKEPVNGNSADRGQFVNEICIQCQVSHPNIVKLEGCCLEVEVPILVYEFVPNGSLHDILHGGNIMPLNMRRRLQIAAQSAKGLAYLHSETPPILHGDVKPANILLDYDLIPKISDFGISRLISTDAQHTGHVIGDRGYMDPVFMQTGRLTSKSDVYSFGVVLLELITRKKSLHSDTNNLINNFLEAYKKNTFVTEHVDKELEVDPELLQSLTRMINQCLNLDISQRPEMKDVEKRLNDMVERFNSK